MGGNPRDVMVVYHHPIHKQYLESSPMFGRYLSGTDKWDYRKLHYEVFRSKPVESGDLMTRRDLGEAYRQMLEQRHGTRSRTHRRQIRRPRPSPIRCWLASDGVIISRAGYHQRILANLQFPVRTP